MVENCNKEDEYIEIGGIKWATKCVGASSPYSYDAWLFQWGSLHGRKENIDGSASQYYGWLSTPFNDNFRYCHRILWEGYKNHIFQGDTLMSYYDAATKYMPESQLKGFHWRMPTKEELRILADNQITITNAIVQGVDGTDIYIGPIPGVGTVKNNKTGSEIKGLCFKQPSTYNDKVLFLPLRGCAYDYTLYTDYIILWSSTCDIDTLEGKAYCLTASNMGVPTVDLESRCFGNCILGVLDNNDMIVNGEDKTYEKFIKDVKEWNYIPFMTKTY